MSDLIDRWAAIALIHSLYPSAPIMRMNRKRWEKKYEPYIEAEKALEQMPSAQPDLSGYSDRLWKAAYERGKAEAQPDIIHCRECTHAIKDELFGGLWCKGKAVTAYHYCGYAERKEGETDETN